MSKEDKKMLALCIWIPLFLTIVGWIWMIDNLINRDSQINEQRILITAVLIIGFWVIIGVVVYLYRCLYQNDDR